MNILLLGDKNSGKKRLVEQISKISPDFILFKNDIKKHRDFNSTYLMDFQHIQIKN